MLISAQAQLIVSIIMTYQSLCQGDKLVLNTDYGLYLGSDYPVTSDLAITASIQTPASF